MSDYPVRRDPRKTIGVVVVAVVLVVAAYSFATYWRPTFVIYTYGSFMDWGDDGAAAVLERAFAPFEEKYNTKIDWRILDADANFIVSKLVAERGNPVADVIIGIDNILILQESAKSVLEPYQSPMLDYVNSTLVDLLDPDHYLTPFDFGFVTTIYSKDAINTTTNPELAQLTFADLATPELSSALVTEDPRLSSPGLSFLLSQIAIYQEILGQDWTTWWEDVGTNIDVEEGWNEAWEAWDISPTKHLLVSYGTDPAYSAYFTGTAPDTAVAPFYYDGQHWAWMQVEGMGLVRNAPHPELGRAFIDYCLNATVQQEIALNQWVYPARSDISLPGVYQYALNPSNISLLNSLLSRTEIAANLQSWLDQWELTRTP
jgi:thiamine transport system substrate-binding protein